MIKSKIAIFLDCFMLSIISFLLIFSWIYRLSRIRLLSILLSIFISLVLFMIMYRIFIKKYKVSSLSAKENKQLLTIVNILKFSSEKDNTAYFEKLFSAKLIEKNIFKNKFSYFYIVVSNKLNSYDFVIANNFYLSSSKKLPLYFICDGTSEEFAEIFSQSPIKYGLFTVNDLFEIIKQKKLYPNGYVTTPKKSRKEIIKQTGKIFASSINKVRFKEFFFTGLSLVVISVIVPFSIYYLISGTILLVLSFLCLILKKNNTKIPKSDEKKLIDLCK